MECGDNWCYIIIYFWVSLQSDLSSKSLRLSGRIQLRLAMAINNGYWFW